VNKRKPSYPRDEFDLAPGAIVRSGVHRGTKSAWSQTWPYLVALILAVGVGFGTIYVLMQSPDSKVNEIINEATDNTSEEPAEDADTDKDADAEEPAESEDPSAGEEPDAEDTDTSEEPAEEEDSEDTASDEPAADVDYAISIRVLNAGSTQGAAGTAASKLTQGGFTAVEAANFEGTLPASSIIYYRGADNKVNAERVGELLGISNFSEVAELRAAVSVVLR
jgi:hypothetical protein